jgi:hypothetical protein
MAAGQLFERCDSDSMVTLSLVSVLPGLENRVEISSFGRCAAKSGILLRRHLEVAVGTSFSSVNNSQDLGVGVIGHRGDNAGGHSRKDSRKLEMQ